MRRFDPRGGVYPKSGYGDVNPSPQSSRSAGASTGPGEAPRSGIAVRRPLAGRLVGDRTDVSLPLVGRKIPLDPLAELTDEGSRGEEWNSTYPPLDVTRCWPSGVNVTPRTGSGCTDSHEFLSVGRAPNLGHPATGCGRDPVPVFAQRRVEERDAATLTQFNRRPVSASQAPSSRARTWRRCYE